MADPRGSQCRRGTMECEKLVEVLEKPRDVWTKSTRHRRRADGSKSRTSERMTSTIWLSMSHWLGLTIIAGVRMGSDTDELESGL